MSSNKDVNKNSLSLKDSKDIGHLLQIEVALTTTSDDQSKDKSQIAH